MKKAPRLLAIILPLVAMLVLSTPALAAPAVTLSPYSGAVGTQVTISGTMFESYRGDNVSILFDSTEIDGSPLTVPQAGNFTISFFIPGDATPGKHWIRVRDEDGDELAKNFFIVREAEIKPDILAGASGTVVTIEGTGFYANKMVTLYYYNRSKEKLGTEITDATGEFSYHFTIPVSIAGKHTIIAENTEGNSAETDFEVVPSLSLNLNSAAPDDLLQASGTGFGYRNDVSLYFGRKEVAFAQTDKYGTFDATFNIPNTTPGAYEVKAEDEDGNIDKTKFTVIAGAKLDTTAGAIGTEIIISGSGFKPGETLIITYDSVQIATTNADNIGAFAGTFNVPLSTSGKHLVTVSGGTTIKELNFDVESIAPPAPTPLLPADGSETRAAAYLDWEDVTDDSTPVTYNLQVAADQNFADILLEKTRILKSEYNLTADEILVARGKEYPYYWRVKAADSATNESEWSAPASFYIAPPPVPALLLPVMNIKAESPVYIDWEDVLAFSPPVTYNLQVAADQNFADDIILEKTALTESEYTLTKEEKLPAVKEEAPYYWRVKAIDNDANESEWSTPETFHVGFSFAPPGWVIFLLIALATILIGFFAFWIGRRTAYSQRQF